MAEIEIIQPTMQTTKAFRLLDWIETQLLCDDYNSFKCTVAFAKAKPLYKIHDALQAWKAHRKTAEAIVYAYSDRTVHLHFFITRIVAGQLQRREHNAFAWVTIDEMSRYEFCPVDTEMLNNYSQRIKVCEHS